MSYFSRGQHRCFRFFMFTVIGLFVASLSIALTPLAYSAATSVGASFPANVDAKKVQSTWLGWYNAVRLKAKLAPYVYNSTLNRTATLWSATAKERGYLNHKRNGQTVYYDYTIMKKWFAAQGVVFTGSGTLFTENIGWGPYRCTKKDCTSEMIDTIRYTFDAYMAEKGKSYRPHYNSIVSTVYTKIGLGIVVDEKKGKLYLTVHYAKKVPTM